MNVCCVCVYVCVCVCLCLSSPVRLVLRAVSVRCCLLSGHRSSLSSACIAAAVTGPVACQRPRRRHLSSLGLPPSLPSADTTADRLTVCRRRQSGVTTWILLLLLPRFVVRLLAAVAAALCCPLAGLPAAWAVVAHPQWAADTSHHGRNWPAEHGCAYATSALLQVLLAMCLSACLSVCLSVSLSLSAAVCRSVGLFVLFPLSCPAAPPALQRGLRRWAAAWLPRARGTGSGVGFTPLPERGSAGALREEGRGDQAVGAWADYDIRLTRLHARPWVGSSLLWVALHRCR